MRNLLLAVAFLLMSCQGCYLKSYPLTPSIVADGTYKIFNNDGSQGTAWAIDEHHLITAGHVCESMSEHYVIIATNSRFNAYSVVWEQSETNMIYDLCLLKTNMSLPNPLVIADRMPVEGESIGYIGFPNGTYTSSTGKYLGDVDGPDSDHNNYVFSAPCAHGASGAPVYFSRGVWGVLVRLRTDGGFIHDGTDGCVAVPLNHLVDFLKDTSVRYSVTPVMPSDPFKSAGE